MERSLLQRDMTEHACMHMGRTHTSLRTTGYDVALYFLEVLCATYMTATAPVVTCPAVLAGSLGESLLGTWRNCLEKVKLEGVKFIFWPQAIKA